MQIRDRVAVTLWSALACAFTAFIVWHAASHARPAQVAFIPLGPVIIERQVEVQAEPAEQTSKPSPIVDPEAGCAPGLTDAVRDWLGDRGSIRIDLARGIAFAHSEVDTGRDGPLPRSFGPEAKLACGSEALWLRSHLQELLRDRYEVACCGTTCTYAGMEYAPNGTVHFERRDDQWILVGWEETYTASLGEESRVRNTEYVQRAMARLATKRCAETAGLDLW